MAAQPDPVRRVRSISQLSPGNTIQAMVNGTVHFQGTVESTHPVMSIFWAVDAIGERRLIDLDLYVVTVFNS